MRLSTVLLCLPACQFAAAAPAADVKGAFPSRPGTINYGSAGAGGISFLCMEYFKLLMRTDIVQVSCKGTGPLLTDLAAGQTPLTITGIPSLLPDVPAMVESGVAGCVVVPRSGISAMHLPVKPCPMPAAPAPA